MTTLTRNQRLVLEHIDGATVAHRDLFGELRREHDLSDADVTSALVGLSSLGLLRLERAYGLTSEGLALVVEVADDPAPTLDGPLPRGAIR